MAVEWGAGKIQLAMTDKPRPPQPPANDDLEAPREVVERGLGGLGQKMWSSICGSMDRPVIINGQRPVPALPRVPQQQGRPPLQLRIQIRPQPQQQPNNKPVPAGKAESEHKKAELDYDDD